MLPWLAAALGLLIPLYGCTTGELTKTALQPSVERRAGVSPSPLVAQKGDLIVPGGGRYQVGEPYQVAGAWYTPVEDKSYDREGMASWYGDDFHGRLTANGEVFNSLALSAAHPTMPLPSYARVINEKNGRSIIVRVNDRGPFARNRLIDLSEHAADLLGFRQAGSTRVRVQYVGKAPLEGDDSSFLLASYRSDSDPFAVASAAPTLSKRGVSPVPPVVLAKAAVEMPSSSTTSHHQEPKPQLIAFTETPKPGTADAERVLTTPLNANERILLAFESASYDN